MPPFFDYDYGSGFEVGFATHEDVLQTRSYGGRSLVFQPKDHNAG